MIEQSLTLWRAKMVALSAGKSHSSHSFARINPFCLLMNS
jgi:hypothetical protein